MLWFGPKPERRKQGAVHAVQPARKNGSVPVAVPVRQYNKQTRKKVGCYGVSGKRWQGVAGQRAVVVQSRREGPTRTTGG